MAAVPDDHLAGTVLALGDHPFKIGIVEGMILNMHGQAPDLGEALRQLLEPLLSGSGSVPGGE